jgi:hypothetical protein
MKTRHLFVWVFFAASAGILFAADEESKVNPKVTALLEQLSKATAESTADLSEAKTDEEKEKLADSHVKLQKFITEKLIPLCTNPVFVKEVAAQNAKGASLDEIKKIDRSGARPKKSCRSTQRN